MTRTKQRLSRAVVPALFITVAVLTAAGFIAGNLHPTGATAATGAIDPAAIDNATRGVYFARPLPDERKIPFCGAIHRVVVNDRFTLKLSIKHRADGRPVRIDPGSIVLYDPKNVIHSAVSVADAGGKAIRSDQAIDLSGPATLYLVFDPPVITTEGAYGLGIGRKPSRFLTFHLDKKETISVEECLAACVSHGPPPAAPAQPRLIDTKKP